MSELWFSRELGGIARYGGMLFAPPPNGVWAVLTEHPRNRHDVARESDELLSDYGGLVHSCGHLLLGSGVRLPPELELWATAPDRPAADLGSWVPGLLLIDDFAQLALSREFDGVRAFATTFSGSRLMVFAPSAETVPALVTREVDAPALGWGEFRGG